MLAARFNEDGHEIVDHHTYVIASDGDIQEGIASEASSLAGHLGLGKLIVFFDDNDIQLASPVDVVFSEDVGKRYEAYGWHVDRIEDVNDLDRIEEATRAAQAVQDRPSFIIVRSHIGYGSPNKQDTIKAHGSPLGDDEIRLTKEAYGWDPDAKFLVPDDALAHFRQSCARGGEAEEEWNERFAAYREAHAEQADLFVLIQSGGLPRRRASPRARPSSGRRRRSPSWSAGRPTWPARRTRTSTTAATSSATPTAGATCASACASTRWARSSTGSRCTASARSTRPSSSSTTT
jgi:transketolase